MWAKLPLPAPTTVTDAGGQASAQVGVGQNTKHVEFRKEIVVADLLSYLILQRIRFGGDVVSKGSDGYDVSRETDVNYWIPFYWLVLDSYLDLREEFEPQLAKTPNPRPIISYFLQSLSDADRNIAAGIRTAIWDLQERGIVIPMKMLPEGMFA